MRRTLLALLFAAACAPCAAKVIANVPQPDGSRIEVHDEAGATCVGSARRAEYVAVNGSRVGGCYVATRAGIFVVFFDGDIAEVPADAIARAAGV